MRPLVAFALLTAPFALGQSAPAIVFDREVTPAVLYGVEMTTVVGPRLARLPPAGLSRVKELVSASGQRALALEVLKSYGAGANRPFLPARSDEEYVYVITADTTDAAGVRTLSLLSRTGQVQRLTVTSFPSGCRFSLLSLWPELPPMPSPGAVLMAANLLGRTRNALGVSNSCGLDGTPAPAELPLVTPAGATSYDLADSQTVLRTATLDMARLSSSQRGVRTVGLSGHTAQSKAKSAMVFELDFATSPTNEMEGVFEVTALTQSTTLVTVGGVSLLAFRVDLTAKDRNKRTLAVTQWLVGGTVPCSRATVTLGGAPVTVTVQNACPP